MKYAVTALAAMFAGKYAIQLIPLHGWIGFILDFIVYSLVFNAIYFTVFYRAPERQYIFNTAINLLGKHLPALKRFQSKTA